MLYRLLLYFFTLVSIAPLAHADISYTVSPLVIDLKAEARDIITREISLHNNGDSPITIYPTVNNISLKEGGTIEEFLAPVESDRTTSLASWLEIRRLGIDLKPGERKSIPLTIRINPNPVPNTYHAFVGFPVGGNRDEAERLVESGKAQGVVVSVTLEEKKNEILKLSKFVVDRFVTKTDNQAAVYTFKNPGDESVVPTGEIIFYDGTGKEVGSVPVNQEGATIAPGEEKIFLAAVPTERKFGKYKAFLSISYGKTQRANLQDTSFFYIFPYKILVTIIFTIVVLVTLLAWYVHRKYFDDRLLDDSEKLTLHFREKASEAKEHDIHIVKHE